MKERFMHAPGIMQLRSIFAGPCYCGPAVHVNMGLTHGDITATCILTVEDAEALIKQIRRSIRTVKSSLNGQTET